MSLTSLREYGRREVDKSSEIETLHENVIAAIGATFLKANLLTDGISLDPSIALNTNKNMVAGLYQHSGESLTFKPPQEIILGDLRDESSQLDGSFMVNVRANKNSKYTLNYSGGDGFVLGTGEGGSIKVSVPDKPPFYDTPIGDVAISQVVQKLGADGLGLVPSNYCSYFSIGDYCRFCEIVPNYKTARVFPKSKKPLDQMQGAIREAIKSDESLQYLFITTGNDPTYDETYDEYVALLSPLKDELKDRGITTFGVLMPPDNFDNIERVHDAGLDSITFNLEVWNRNLAEWMTPGKVKYGRDKMLQALDKAVDVFGKGFALTNLVYGIQSYEPGNANWNFDPDREKEVLIEAIDELLFLGVLPTHTVYHTSGVNPIGKIKLDGPKMFNYHMEYAAKVYDSKVVPSDRPALFSGLATVSNSLFNDAYATTKMMVDGFK